MIESRLPTKEPELQKLIETLKITKNKKERLKIIDTINDICDSIENYKYLHMALKYQ